MFEANVARVRYNPDRDSRVVFFRVSSPLLPSSGPDELELTFSVHVTVMSEASQWDVASLCAKDADDGA